MRRLRDAQSRRLRRRCLGAAVETSPILAANRCRSRGPHRRVLVWRIGRRLKGGDWSGAEREEQRRRPGHGQ